MPVRRRRRSAGWQPSTRVAAASARSAPLPRDDCQLAANRCRLARRSPSCTPPHEPIRCRPSLAAARAGIRPVPDAASPPRPHAADGRRRRSDHEAARCAGKKPRRKAEEKPTQSKGGDGDVLPEITWTDLSTEKWTVKPGAQMQLDSINWADHSPAIPAFNYVEFRRLRLMLDGVGYGVYDFRVQMEFEPESSEAGNVPGHRSPRRLLLDERAARPFRRARIGHFFVPFSLEQVTNDVLGVFLERSIPTQASSPANAKSASRSTV